MRWAGAIVIVVGCVAAAAADDAAVAGRACARDGDSLFVGGKVGVTGLDCIGPVEIRLHGIDAPEWDQPCTRPSGEEWACGTESTRALARLIDGRQVTCQVLKRDGYGRAVARCLAGGEDLEAVMVREGWALAYRYYSKRYVPEEEAAKAARAGMWSGSFTSPYDWRKRQREK